MSFDLTDEPVQIILGFIRRTETGKPDPEAYDILFGGRTLSPPLTQRTLGDVIAAGRKWSRAHGSSAAGAYQFMHATLMDLRRILSLPNDTRLDPPTQDRMAFYLVGRRGLQDFLADRIPLPVFAHNLAREWAGLPVLRASVGAHRQIERGDSYYSGDGVNGAVVSAEEVEAMLNRALDARGRKVTDAVQDEEAGEPATPRVSPVWWAAAAAAVGALMGAAATLPCRLLGVFCA